MRIVQSGLAMLAATLVAGAASAGSTVLYNNFGAGDSYNTGSGWTISDGAPVNTDWDQGFHFTVSGGDFFLSQLDFAMGFVTGANSVTLTVYDSVGGVPGTALESVSLGGFGAFGNANPPATALFAGTTLLEDGAEYHIIASSPENAWLAWNVNSEGVLGRVFRQDLGAWTRDDANLAPAARVWGEAIPAPGALALLGVGVVVGSRRRRA